MRPPISAWLGGTDAVLLGGLAIAVLLGWMAWRQRPTPSARYVWLGALSLLATVVLRVPVQVLADLKNLDNLLWMGPFDRLLGVTVLVMLGWTLTTGTRTWRIFLIAGFAATAITYLGWAQTWAQDFIAQPNLTADPTGLARIWDAWQIMLAVAVGGAMVRTSPRVPSWLLAAVGSLAVGSFLELVNPTLPYPAWTRLGTLVAGAFFVAAAVTQTVDLSSFRSRETDVSSLPPRPDGSPPDDDEEPSVDTVAAQVLFETSARLYAAPVLFCLVDASGGLEIWGLTEQGKQPRRLGKLPLASHPTIGRALGSSGLRLRTSRIARDIDQLYGLMGISGGGPVLLQPVTTTQGVAVIVAGRPGGRWKESDQRRLAAIARRAARSLESLWGEGGGRHEIVRVYDALESQTARLERIVEGLAERLNELEDSTDRDARSSSAEDSATVPEGAATGTEAATTVPEDAVTGTEGAATGTKDGIDADATAPTLGTETAVSVAGPGEVAELELPDLGEEFDARVLRYEMALEAIPWGIMVADADGGVVFANAGAARLLNIAALRPGQPFHEIFPDAERVAVGLKQCREAAMVAIEAGDGADLPHLELPFDAPAVLVELDPLFDASFGYLGAVAVVRPQAQPAPGVESEVMTALTEALKSPMTSILGYSDLLSRGVGLNHDQLDRYLQRIDANMSRMQVNLQNLLTVLDAGAERLNLDPVDLSPADAMGAALERAEPQLDEKSISARFEPAETLPDVLADAGAVEQILDNLVANSVHRSPQGGDIELVVEAVDSAAGGTTVVFTVADRGPSAVAKGAGAVDFDDAAPGNVSLTVVRLLAERLGGKAWAEARGGQTRFRVSLPRGGQTLPTDR